MKPSKTLYLIADASDEFGRLYAKIKEAVDGGIGWLQLFNSEKAEEENLKTLQTLCKTHKVRFILHQNTALAQRLNADGVHLDELPENFEKPSLLLVGVTVGNDLEKIKKAANKGIDYLSFCSVFPSRSANVCELVRPENIVQARSFFKGTLFLAGGITTQTIPQLKNLDFQGVALISEIMEAENITEKLKALRNELTLL
ncbi:thiamine phosphate synthase [Bergeyella sp. RCAD1439]|uniref:thiamine phosphate synthase n=1 Tax=Bergeyella anatis TaxID=3113737 RepID=UPI002E172AB6|nr:thiamine phosphate synthase [Bergeyella sp. RCAD1439]